MSAQRPHIHLICDANDSSLHSVQDALVIFCENKVRLSRDLFGISHETANYSWRCINDCDYVLMIVGESYGKLNNSGVSQLHISYLNARTKNKAMAILLCDAPTRPRQLADFINAIVKQEKHIYHFGANSNLEPLFNQIFNDFGSRIIAKPTLANSPAVPVGATTIGSEQRLLPYEQKPYEQKQATASLSQSPSKSAAQNKATNAPPNTPTPNASPSVPPTVAKFELDDELLINCTAHAFKGGTLIEVSFVATSTWQAVLSALTHTSMSFSSQGMWRILNELVAEQAMSVIKPIYPEVHAISRCQVTKADIIWLQEELQAAGWISKSDMAGKAAWKTTEQAHRSLEQYNQAYARPTQVQAVQPNAPQTML